MKLERLSLLCMLLVGACGEPSAPKAAENVMGGRAAADNGTGTISGPTFVSPGHPGTWVYNYDGYILGWTHVQWWDGSTLLGTSGLGAPFTHWPSNSFTLQARLRTFMRGSWVLIAQSDLFIETGAPDPSWCNGTDQSAWNYCKTSIARDPDGAAPYQNCTYTFSSNLPNDSQVIWRVNGEPKLTGLRNVIGDSFPYTHESDQSFELRVEVQRHFATHAEKIITVSGNNNCNA